ncbi:efflux RND transporter permease subunit [Fulvivirga lutimaris]|uniref:efflux RND transporter permease subunit n=1 Tax=Fulvivirga lutimaris TaxID=1819566 RepID=UPI0012BB4A16|nr:MMPL family transporter [Fulvivirga lutimaris]MTI39506.1 hypothetical protein [Fulvivirga lutimaris]
MTKKLAVSTILFILLITVLSISQLTSLKFNYVFEDFFPVDDPELEFYKDFSTKFENDNDYLLIGIENNQGVFKRDLLTKVKYLTDSLEKLAEVQSVVSITNIELPIISKAGIFNIPLVHPSEPARLEADSTRLYKQPHFIGSLVSDDGKSTVLVIRHINFTSKETTDQFLEIIQTLLQQSEFEQYHIAGKTYAQGIFIGLIQEELMTFISASVVLVILFLGLAYRNWWGIVIPLLIVSVSTIWILGFMAITGKSLDILMGLLPTIMFVVGMSDVVHLKTKYIENLRNGDNKIQSIKTAAKEVGMATFLTSLTTSVGFLTLYTASIRPIQEFGLYTALGVVIAFVVTFTLLPSCMLLLPAPSISVKVAHKTSWIKLLGRCFLGVMKNKTTVLVSSAALVLISVYGINQIVVNTYLIEDLPNDHPLKVSFNFFDQKLGGSRPFEVAVQVKDSSKTVFSPEVASKIEEVSEYLKSSHEVGGLRSSNSVLKALNQAVNSGSTDEYILPEGTKEWKAIERPLKRIRIKGDLEGKLTANGERTGRITGWIDDIGSAISLERNAEFRRFVDRTIANKDVDFVLTGTSNLIDKNNRYLAENMMKGLGIAFAVVALIAGLLFRSFRMVLITLIPNIIPLMMVAGIMGIFGITLKLSTSIVFTIAFGIAVDDTIHFTSKLKLELDKGKSLIYALKRTYLSTGKAIIVTSIILSGGFLILILSSFGGTFFTGLLISLTLIFALIIDLTLLPTFIVLFFKRDRKLNQ